MKARKESMMVWMPAVMDRRGEETASGDIWPVAKSALALAARVSIRRM